MKAGKQSIWCLKTKSRKKGKDQGEPLTFGPARLLVGVSLTGLFFHVVATGEEVFLGEPCPAVLDVVAVDLAVPLLKGAHDARQPQLQQDAEPGERHGQPGRRRHDPRSAPSSEHGTKVCPGVRLSGQLLPGV